MKLTSRMHDYTGETFGSLTAIRPHARKYDNIEWVFECVCGNAVTYIPSVLIHRHNASCGCKPNRQPNTHGKNIHQLAVDNKKLKARNHNLRVANKQLKKALSQHETYYE